MKMFTSLLCPLAIKIVVIIAQNQADFGQWSLDNGRPVDPTVCTRANCRLPSCFCAGKDAPLGMDPSVIPQMVMFTFDDAVNEQVTGYYDELFPMERVNPNGCPVTITLFVSHNWTDYNAVNRLHNRGHEIASHSVSHRMPQSWWRYATAKDWENEIVGQQKNLVEKARIPNDNVVGMRAPFLDVGGDAQYEMITQFGLKYDASFMTGPYDKGGVWPFTLDTITSWEYCTNMNCPKNPHPGIWEVPLNRVIGVDGQPCSMLDSCLKQPSNKGEALSYLWQNFNRYYYGNRAPFGINMHAVWFKTTHLYEAMKEFVKRISEMDDVYLLTVQQTVAWMRNPQTIERARNFRPWLQSCRVQNPRQMDIPTLRPETLRHQDTDLELNRISPNQEHGFTRYIDTSRGFTNRFEYIFDNDSVDSNESFSDADFRRQSTDFVTVGEQKPSRESSPNDRSPTMRDTASVSSIVKEVRNQSQDRNSILEKSVEGEIFEESQSVDTAPERHNDRPDRPVSGAGNNVPPQNAVRRQRPSRNQEAPNGQQRLSRNNATGSFSVTITFLTQLCAFAMFIRCWC